MAGQPPGAPGDYKMPRRFGEGDPSQFDSAETALIARLKGRTVETALPGERLALLHLRQVGHGDFQ